MNLPYIDSNHQLNTNCWSKRCLFRCLRQEYGPLNRFLTRYQISRWIDNAKREAKTLQDQGSSMIIPTEELYRGLTRGSDVSMMVQ
ncbi:hypothetical protein CPB83DRAFT_854370 [Crepidotus variabilis]|uniref:Uncharacterized protein n=1 Tax=Crepidotus variabilis TaxID=179855 RepID=A0A9P6EGA1_9AGAR|nr:hypothetical protein CPB83DRAFT_854370 [Crepidotus variabilis]